MKQAQGCGCNKAPSQPGPKLSTSGVGIMGSMDEVPSCAVGPDRPGTAYGKPGYRLCSFVDRFITTDAGPVPLIKPKLTKDDRLPAFLVRCGLGRYSYTVSPGLYGIGSPDKHSEVLVTANFKLTFDHLRKELPGIHAWILVLDTQGINVWCAAGKGTFSAQELVKQIKAASLEKVVGHKRLILPQLGATGVSASEVKKQSGFRVIYGPVRAKDIPAFLKNDKTADKTMRQVTFSLYERFILTPVELRMALKPALMFALAVFIISGFGPGIFSFAGVWDRGRPAFFALVTGIISGAVVTPILLPHIPFRQFAVKGILSGTAFALIFLLFSASAGFGFSGVLALFLFSVTVSSYLAMNFTGATPFTSPSGVEKEMKRFIPVQLAGLGLSSGLWIYSAF